MGIMPLDRKLFRNLDHGLLIVILLVVLFGVVIVYSATRGDHTQNMGDPLFFVKRQALAALLGLILMAAILSTDYLVFQRLSGPIYWVNLGMLALVLLVGHRVSGAQSWVRLGPLAFQPSEFSKVLVIMTLANHLAGKGEIDSLAGLASPIAHAAVPMALILLQNDLGTTLVFGAVLLGMLYVAGVRGRDLGLLVGAGALASP
ncbi:MAG TPA: FtsW/RodA/SpoVE family cell cycle protein, partial [Firmicutes bacterium]|nr:FtsW/RodA/SpoVE family cell cycle protein [Bacillota bacterium]